MPERAIGIKLVMGRKKVGCISATDEKGSRRDAFGIFGSIRRSKSITRLARITL